jgi:hypothetical protein
VFAAYSFILPLARLNSNFLFLPPPRSLPAPHRFAPNRLHRTPCRSTASPSATRPHFESEMKNLASSDVEPLLTPTLTGSTTIKSPGMWFSSPVKASPSTRTRGSRRRMWQPSWWLRRLRQQTRSRKTTKAPELGEISCQLNPSSMFTHSSTGQFDNIRGCPAWTSVV